MPIFGLIAMMHLAKQNLTYIYCTIMFIMFSSVDVISNLPLPYHQYFSFDYYVYNMCNCHICLFIFYF